MPYDYPPSQKILTYGPLQEGTHFYGEGILYAEQSFGTIKQGKPIKEISCNFEIAYSFNNEVIIICYIQDFTKQPIARNGWGSAEFNNMTVICEKLVGTTIQSELGIVAEQLIPITSQLGFFGDSEIHYRAINYKVSENSEKAGRLIEHFKEANSEYKKPDPYFEISGIDLQRTNPIFFVTSELVESPATLSLLPKRKKSELNYPNQTVAHLVVPESCCPPGWTIENVAEFWCALYSLATGQDVQSTALCKLISEQHAEEQLWYSRHLSADYRGHAYIAFPIQLDEIRDFITQAFLYATNNYADYSELWGYVFYLRLHIHYLTLKTSDATGTARLLATLTEALVQKWKRTTKFKFPKRLQPSQLKQFRETVKTALENSPEKYKLRPLAEETAIFLNQHINEPSLRELIEAFFKVYEHDTDKDEELKKRIRAFAATRNAVAHEGTLAWLREKRDKNLVKFSKNEKDEWFLEAQNVEAMIPLMLFCLFGYEGEYFDPVGFTHREWRKTKTN